MKLTPPCCDSMTDMDWQTLALIARNQPMQWCGEFRSAANLVKIGLVRAPKNRSLSRTLILTALGRRVVNRFLPNA